MLTWPSGTKVFVCTRATDMRCGFDSLAEQVRQFLGEDPLGGHLFVFRNKRGDRLKVLYWDTDGLALWYKRLEAGTFRLPAAAADASFAGSTTTATPCVCRPRARPRPRRR